MVITSVLISGTTETILDTAGKLDSKLTSPKATLIALLASLATLSGAVANCCIRFNIDAMTVFTVGAICLAAHSSFFRANS